MKRIILVSAILFTFGCGVKKGTTVTKTKTTTNPEQIVPLLRSDVIDKKGNVKITPPEMEQKAVFNSDEVKLVRITKKKTSEVDDDGVSLDTIRTKREVKIIPEGTEGRIIKTGKNYVRVLFSSIDPYLYVDYYTNSKGGYYYLSPRDGKKKFYKETGKNYQIYSDVGSKLEHRKELSRKNQNIKFKAEGYRG